MVNTRKSQTANSKPKISWKNTKITKPKHLKKIDTKVVQSVTTRRSVPSNQLNFGNLHQSDLESKIVWHVLSNFTLAQQLKMRTISPVWDYNVQLACKQIRSLVLEFDKTDFLENRSRQEEKYFKRNINENLKQFTVSNSIDKAGFIIQTKEWSHRTNAALGKLFCNVEQLALSYTVDSDNNELLFNLLRYFPKVTEFSFIVPNKITNCNQHFTTKLFAAIARHLAPLNSLHLFFESIHCPKVRVSNLRQILPFLQNLTLRCPVENYHQIIGLMGTDLSPHLPIQSLSLCAQNLNKSQIASMFEHNPQLVKIKRLQLVDVESRKVVDCLLQHFTELEYLEIDLGEKYKTKSTKKNKYSVKWLKTFSKLTHLTELVMYGMHPRNFYIELPETLSTVRSLTFSCTDFLLNFFIDWRKVNEEFAGVLDVEIYDQLLKEFVNCLATQYPNLEELTFGWDFDYGSNLKELLLAQYNNNLKIYTYTICDIDDNSYNDS